MQLIAAAMLYIIVAPNSAVAQSRLEVIKNGAGNTVLRLPNNNENIFISDGFGVPGDTSTRNVALGAQALQSNLGGSSNVAIGSRALKNNLNGEENLALGWEALKSNDGNGNIAMGVKALQANVGGYWNLALGNRSLFSMTEGFENLSIGSFAMYSNTTGERNVVLGHQAGEAGADYSSCTLVGALSSVSGGSQVTNSTAIGHGAQVTSSNQVRIGNGSVTSIGGVAPWSVVSDRRVKKNISEDLPGLDFVMKLRPVAYNLDLSKWDSQYSKDGPDRDTVTYTGFIAQDIQLILEDLGVKYAVLDTPSTQHELYALRYSELIAILTKAIQELYEIVAKEDIR